MNSNREGPPFTAIVGKAKENVLELHNILTYLTIIFCGFEYQDCANIGASNVKSVVSAVREAFLVHVYSQRLQYTLLRWLAWNQRAATHWQSSMKETLQLLKSKSIGKHTRVMI